MRGVILAGGFAKRMMPASKVINKHLMPVYIDGIGSIPMIYFALNTLIKSGINEILIITSDEAAGMMVDMVGDGRKFGDSVDITYKIQNMHDPLRPVGIAGALKLAKVFTGDEKFAVILGDNFFEDSFEYEISQFKNSDYKGHIFLKKVDDPERFGVAHINMDNNEVIDIEEKPKVPKSNYASTGLYLFDKCVYDIADTLVVSDRKELEIVDIHNTLISSKSLRSSFVKNFWHDLGTPKSMMTAQEYLKNKDFKFVFNM
jgi:glucose-1-phosphate thymidylyltransferase